MPSPTSLVDNLRPNARVQQRPTDLTLRAVGGGSRNNLNLLTWDMSAFASFTVQVWTGSTMTLLLEGSNDGVNWAQVDYWIVGKMAAPFSRAGALMSGGAPTILAGNKQTRFIRARAISYGAGKWNGITVQLSQQPHQRPLRPWTDYEDSWTYAAASGGITTTTPVTLAAGQAGTGFKAQLTSLELSNAGTAGTEVIVRDDANSAVLWRGYLPAGANQVQHQFNPPLRTQNGNAGIALLLSSGTNVQVYANARGLYGLG